MSAGSMLNHPEYGRRLLLPASEYLENRKFEEMARWGREVLSACSIRY